MQLLVGAIEVERMGFRFYFKFPPTPTVSRYVQTDSHGYVSSPEHVLSIGARLYELLKLGISSTLVELCVPVAFRSRRGNFLKFV